MIMRKQKNYKTHTVETVYSSCLVIAWVREPLFLLNISAGGLGCHLALSMGPVLASLCFLPL